MDLMTILLATRKAAKYADQAEAAVNNAAIISFNINNNGHLIMDRTEDITDLDFSINARHKRIIK